MTKFFYEWEDTSDRYSTGVPDLGRHQWARAKTKAAVRQEWREYLAAFPDIAIRKPKIRVWKVSYDEVSL
jgi:hypothetical protein